MNLAPVGYKNFINHSVGFGAGRYSGVPTRKADTPVSSRQRQAQMNNNDSAIFRDEISINPVNKKSKEAIRQQRRKAAWMNFLKGVALGSVIMLPTGVVIGNNQANKPSAYEKPISVVYEVQDEQASSYLDALAQINNVEAEDILCVNDVQDEKKLEGKEDIIIPTRYSLVDAQIEELKDKISKADIEELTEYQTELQNLLDKKAQQDEVGYCFTDGDDVYIKIVDESYCENFEELKSLFDIEDGGLRCYEQYNNVQRHWVDSDSDVPEDSGMFYYGGIAHGGNTYKVPKKYIDGK